MNIDEIIFAWKMHYGKKIGRFGIKIIPLGDRFISICSLVRTLKEKHNYTKESFTPAIKDKIISVCVNTCSDSTKLKSWKYFVAEDIEKALFKIYPTVIEFIENEITEAEKSEMAQSTLNSESTVPTDGT